MKPQFKIYQDPQNDGLTIHPITAKRLGIFSVQNISLRFGVRSYQTIIRNSLFVGLNEILLCSEAMNVLMIPPSCTYELLIRKNIVTIGPFIGILESKRGMEKVPELVSHYDKIGGAILAFTEKAIDLSNQTITGQMFNPETKQWDQGVYSYPASLFKKIRVSEETRNHLKSIIGQDRIFNTPIFDKWEMHKLLVSLPELKRNTPDTILYKKPGNFREFLELHKQVYIKPIGGHRGIGILKASIVGGQILVQFREQNNNRRHLFKTMKEAGLFVERTLTSEKYIVQKAIDRISWKRRFVDFRLTIVKNETGRWVEAGFFARYGQPESIVSNVTEGGKSDSAQAAFKRILRLSDSQALKLKMRMVALGMKMAKNFDHAAVVHYGNLGLDLALDTSGHMWIIEVNKDPSFIGRIRDQAQLSNMLYAKRLAGFYE